MRLLLVDLHLMGSNKAGLHYLCALDIPSLLSDKRQTDVRRCSSDKIVRTKQKGIISVPSVLMNQLSIFLLFGPQSHSRAFCLLYSTQPSVPVTTLRSATKLLKTNRRCDTKLRRNVCWHKHTEVDTAIICIVYKYRHHILQMCTTTKIAYFLFVSS